MSLGERIEAKEFAVKAKMAWSVLHEGYGFPPSHE
jgi:hypothetical protein